VRRFWLSTIASLLLITAFVGRLAYASAPTGDLTIIQFKMTGTESVVIENNSPSNLSLSNYLLEYFNKSSPASLAVPTSSQQLPAITLLPRQTILLNSDSSPTCGAAAVANLSFSLSDTSGYLMIAKVGAQADGSLVFAPQDHVNWTSSTSGADIIKVPSNTADPAAVWYRKLSDGSWQQAELGADCNSLLALLTPAATATFVDWSDGDAAPSTIISLASSGDSGPGIPSSDIGLAAPQITEILPNPASPQTDDEDEFIEIYNPNDTDFDLSGFKLQVGTATKHTYTIPAGTTMPAKSFKAFFSIDTNLAMSNTSGQAFLLDPLNTVLGQTDVYASAKDGQAWALANGHWYWTNSPTPGQPNAISQTSSSGSSKSASKTSTSVKGASASSSSGVSTAATTTPSASLHPWTLAIVGIGALLYAGYEYRTDLYNNFHRARRYFEARRGTGR